MDGKLGMNTEVRVKVICPFCPEDKKTRIMRVNETAYLNWRNGMLIQDAFPDLTPADREALITGICDKCWENTFEEEW